MIAFLVTLTSVSYLRCIQQLLSATSEGRGQIFVSYLQIYCELVSDLLLDQGLDHDVVGDQDKSVGPRLSSAPLHLSGAATGAVPAVGYGYNPNHLSIRERAGSVYVEGLSRSRITSLRDLNDLLAKGDLNRHTASTNMNETSSRSHAALIITTIMRDSDGDSGDGEAALSISGGGSCCGAVDKEGKHLSYIESSLVIVDLAGSERYN